MGSTAPYHAVLHRTVTVPCRPLMPLCSQEGFVAADDASATDDYAREEDEEGAIREMIARAQAAADMARQAVSELGPTPGEGAVRPGLVRHSQRQWVGCSGRSRGRVLWVGGRRVSACSRPAELTGWVSGAFNSTGM
jgi:hypothetical protein